MHEILDQGLISVKIILLQNLQSKQRKLILSSYVTIHKAAIDFQLLEQ